MCGEWREVPTEPGYHACPEGHIKGPSGRILKPGTRRSGHKYITAYRGRTRTVHALVLEAFVGLRPDEPNIVGLHADDNPANNAITNLSWGTQRKNVKDQYLRGRRPTKLCEDTVREIRRLFHDEGESKKGLARRFGVTDRTIQQIVLRHTWAHI